MEVDLDALEILYQVEEGLIGLGIGLFEDKIHISDRLMIMYAENQMHQAPFDMGL